LNSKIYLIYYKLNYYENIEFLKNNFEKDFEKSKINHSNNNILDIKKKSNEINNDLKKKSNEINNNKIKKSNDYEIIKLFKNLKNSYGNFESICVIHYGKGNKYSFDSGYSLENIIDQDYSLNGIKSFPCIYSYPEKMVF
jgi:predicted Holliday junction resolvase-like endonuclease